MGRRGEIERHAEEIDHAGEIDNERHVFQGEIISTRDYLWPTFPSLNPLHNQLPVVTVVCEWAGWPAPPRMCVLPSGCFSGWQESYCWAAVMLRLHSKCDHYNYNYCSKYCSDYNYNY